MKVVSILSSNSPKESKYANFPKSTIPLNCTPRAWCVKFFIRKHCRTQTQRSLSSGTQPSPAGETPHHQERATASDLQVLTLIPTTSHPAGTRSSTVQWSWRDAASIHTLQRRGPRLLFDILSLISCFHLALHLASLFLCRFRGPSSYFDSEGSLHLSRWVISRPARLDRHLGSAAGEVEGKAGQ